MIAMGLAGDPKLLIADEPTTALDVTIQAQIVDLVRDLKDRLNMSVVWITHDLALIAVLADRIAVLYAGTVVEDAPVEAIFALKSLVDGLGGVTECRTDGARLPADNRAAYAGSARIEDLDAADRVLIIGANPRAEAPVLNARIRKAWVAGAEIGGALSPVPKQARMASISRASPTGVEVACGLR
jgi:ABC-type methionine transport system ATPase subunit